MFYKPGSAPSPAGGRQLSRSSLAAKMQSPHLLFAKLGLLGTLLLLPACVTFTYPRYVDNEPLDDPIQVNSVTDRTVRLADGRAFVLVEPPDHYIVTDEINEWARVLELEDITVEIGADPHTGGSVLYLKQRIYRCPVVAPHLNIPIRAYEMPMYRRVPFGTVVLVDAQGS